MAAASGRRALAVRPGGLLRQPLGKRDPAPAGAAGRPRNPAHGDELARPLLHRRAGLPGARAPLFLPVRLFCREAAPQARPTPLRQPPRPSETRFRGASGAQRRHYARSRRGDDLWHRLRDFGRGRVGFPWSLAVAGAGVVVLLPALVPLAVGGAFAWAAYALGSNVYRSFRKHLSPPGRELHPPRPTERPFRIPTAMDVLAASPARLSSPFIREVLSWATKFALGQVGATMEATEAVHDEAVRLLKTRAEPQVSRILGARVSYGPVTATRLSAVNINGIGKKQAHISFPVTSSRGVPVASVDVAALWKAGKGGEPVVEITEILLLLPDGRQRAINVRDLGTEENEQRRVFEGEYREIKE